MLDESTDAATLADAIGVLDAFGGGLQVVCAMVAVLHERLCKIEATLQGGPHDGT